MAIDELPIASPIQPKVEDSSLLDFGRQWVGEAIRDNVNEDVGTWIQPDLLSINGKQYKTNNKTFNTLSKDELNEELTSLTANSPEEADGTLYKLVNKKTGQVKYGRAKDDVHSRYQYIG